jgi:hypothetical protein
LKPGPAGSYIDTVLGRPVSVASCSPDLLDRARVFIGADLSALALVYRFDPRQNQLWFEAPTRRPDHRLDAVGRARLAEAIEALHKNGGYHGRVDGEHLGWRGDDPVLWFPIESQPTTLAGDLKGLDAL